MKKWVLYCLIVAFAVYWASNLILWFPWSINPKLGMTLMLTVGTALWTIATYNCLIRYPGKSRFVGASISGFVLLLSAVIMDYVFFGLIRNAIKELYHPTTFYGYAFVACLPFIMILTFRKIIEQNSRELEKKDLLKIGFAGLICFALITLIIIFKIEI